MAEMKLTRDGTWIGPCAACKALNRVRPARLLSSPRCGRCGEALPPPSEPLAATGPALQALVASAPIPVVVDFWADWCAPCRSFAPTFARFAQESAGRVLAVKVDTQAEPDAASRHQIQSIPTLVVFKEGREAARTSGALSRAQLDQLVERA